MAASFAPALAQADISQELKDEVNAAEVELRGLEKDKATPVADLIGVHGRLGRLCKQANWPKKALEHWKKVGELFAKAKLVKNGGTEATWAAEALFNLLDERATAAMLSQPAPGRRRCKPGAAVSPGRARRATASDSPGAKAGWRASCRRSLNFARRRGQLRRRCCRRGWSAMWPRSWKTRRPPLACRLNKHRRRFKKTASWLGN
jgi:hypothetical protein